MPAWWVRAATNQLDHEAAQRVPNQKWWRVQRGDECHQVVGVVTKAQWCDRAATLVQGQLMMAQRRAMHRVATLFEGGPGGSPLLPAAPRAVNQHDVLGVGHETKGDSQWPRRAVRTSELPLRSYRLVSGPPTTGG